jgi:serine/threonine protein kinase
MADLPSQIGRYEIKSLIGRGGMGDLYLARDPNTSRLVALKLLNALVDSVELRERFAREARALAALNHPNIVNIYDTGEYDGAPFIVMEYIRGETLAEIIKRRARLSVARKLELMMDLCAGLAQAHNADIIHRDIKPANLMVDQQGRLKILDFGIARVAEENRTRGGPLTQVDMMIGTPGYMSPEQIEGGEVDHRSDLFAVGAVCYELLAYSEAFGGDNTMQVDRRARSGQIVPLSALIPGIDPELDAIVQRALKRDPNGRFQDAATFGKALERARSRLGADELPEPPRPTPPLPAGGRMRAAKAQAAYERAVDALRRDSREAARRFAVEAVAEDPSHTEAIAFLRRLDRATAGSATQVATPGETLASETPAGATAVSTSVGPSGTLVDRTAMEQSPVEATSTFDSAPTIIVSPDVTNVVRRPSPRGSARETSSRAPWKSDKREFPATREKAPSRPESRAPERRNEPFWMRYRTALGIGVPIALVLIIGLVVLLFRMTGASTKVLTITRPVGGTIFGPGIRCGTAGADCSATPRSGDSIALTVEADTGYTFNGYSGDCAAGGRAYMDAPRVCGATFVANAGENPPSGPTQILTIAPVPTGGTLVDVDISCGSKGSQCSASYPEGVPVELRAQADDGFTFMGFKGDCAPTGHTQMVGPRTCSGAFSPIAIVSMPPIPVKPPPRSVAAPPPGTAAPVGIAPPPLSPPPPAGGRVVDTTSKTAQPVVAPQSDEDFAKGKIQDALKAYCEAEQQLSPEGVQAVYPKTDIEKLRRELNVSKYKSIKCAFSDVVFQQLDAPGGKAKVQAGLKQTFEHTILTPKIVVSELIATMSFYRGGDRGLWLIDNMTFTPK